MTNLIVITIVLLTVAESDGHGNRVGDHGKAIGILQMHKEMVDEVNRLFKTKYTYSDRADPWRSVEMAQLYLTWAAKEYSIVSPVQLAYRWNKPRHGKVSATYRRRIVKAMHHMYGVR